MGFGVFGVGRGERGMLRAGMVVGVGGLLRRVMNARKLSEIRRRERRAFFSLKVESIAE